MALKVALPTILVLLGIWLLADQSIYSSDLQFPKFVKSNTENDQITWHNFQNFTRSIDLENSTAIFNSIHAALRQKDSDIHPVGVTYFPAVVPKGTLMYHAGGGQIPDGLEWLAMDPEFSLNFGSRRQPYGRRSLKRRRPGPPREKDSSGGGPPMPPGNETHTEFSRSMTMMTFRATRDLNRFLYLDGASAAKSITGEMDTQKMLSDLIGLNSNSSDGHDGQRNGMSERLYAERICSWGKNLGLDGFIRVEVGFELVLCDFLDGSTELVSNVSFPSVSDLLELPQPTKISLESGWPLDDAGSLIEDDLTEEQLAILDREDEWEEKIRKFDSMVSFDQVRAGQVHDKGDKRIQLDYRHMVTAINRTYLNPDPNNRRLLNDGMTHELQLGIFKDLERAVEQGFDSSESTDWQQVFDEIVDKFSPILDGLQSVLENVVESDSLIAENATRYTVGFVRRFSEQHSPDRSLKLGSGRKFAVYQYTRPLKDLTTQADYLIWSASVRVVTEIVDTIYDIHEWLWPLVFSDFHRESSENTSSAVMNSGQRIKELIKVLNWISLNYECESLCKRNEVCFTPSWGPSPLDWATPDSTEQHFGMHYDYDRQRQVIDSKLKCIDADFLLNHRD